MLKTSPDHNPNYLAKIHQIQNLRPHPNADRLQMTVIDGNSVIVGINAQIGDWGVYFPVEAQVDAGFLSTNNQFDSKDLNADKETKGFFGKNGRVRAVALRSAKSEGFWCPVEFFTNWQPNLNITLEHGTYFDTVNDTLLVKKYVIPSPASRTQAQPKSGKQKKRESKLIENQFRFHVDTLQFGRNAHQIRNANNVIITQKLHGTSAVFANVMCKRKLSWKDKFAKWFGAAVTTTQYDYLYSSRQVIKNDKEPAGAGWYKVDIWGKAFNEIKWTLEEGITIYAEIVGYVEGTRCIQKGYDYGCKVGEFDIYVYRITQTSPVGHVYEFTWEQVEAYCEKYSLKPVPLLFKGSLADFKVVHFPYGDLNDEDGLTEALREQYCEKMLPNGKPDEGVCLRLERGASVETYKLKSFKFLEHESKQLDTGEVDIESAESTTPSE
jgi:hypothetical protein